MEISFSLTLIIILVTTGISVMAFEKPELKYKYIFSPYQVIHHKKWYKVITHAFIHADWMHLGFNMYVLYLFGNLTEEFLVIQYDDLGYILYLALYIGGALFATLPAMTKHRDNDLYFSLGASGAVSSILFAAILIVPSMELLVFFAIPMKAVLFGILYLVLEYVLSKNSKSRIAHDAHFAGAIFGIIFMLLLDFNYFINNFIIEVQNLF